MPFDLDISDTRPIYVQIMDEIRRGIVLGIWRPDEPLPSVRQLAVELRVNPNTVQQAYRELEREGVVYVKRGQGTFVTAAPTAQGRGQLLTELARQAARSAWRSGFTTAELIDALRSHSRNGTQDGGET